MNRDFLNELPKEVDPCGENGEFHTFCYDGPIFKQSIDFSKGRKVVKKYANPSGKGCVKFHFLDIM